MRLMTAHKILIGTGVAFFALFSALQWKGLGDGSGSLPLAMAGLAAALLLAIYLRSLRGK